MARKRNAAPDPAALEPDAVPAVPPEPTPPESDPPKVVNMPVRDLLQMLGRTLPENVPLQARAAPALPAGMDAEAKITDLTAGELIGLLAAFRG